MDYSQLSPEKQAEIARIKAESAERMKQINRDALKGYGRIALGGTMQGLSMLPIMNIPYVGTGLGGDLFEAGQGVMEGKKAADIARQASKGFAIGETVGAIPYAGKAIGRTKVGAAVGDSIGRQVGKLADTQIGRKAADIGAKVGDVLMTDIKAFNPNKQIMYHGSPYDFNKFSNEAIGTGEGAQAHGYGHYAALNKDVADTRYRSNAARGVVLNDILKDTSPDVRNYVKNSFYAADDIASGINKAKELLNKDMADTYDLNKSEELMGIYEKLDKLEPQLSTQGQLYKLAIPKDDVLLREDELFNHQPQEVQEKLWDLAYELQDKGNRGKRNLLNALAENKSGKQIYETIWDMYNDADIYGADGAAKLLSDKGIKGISYNGGIDGEAAVIFNPDDIDIVRKFYNKPGALEYLKRINPNIGAEAVAIDNNIVDKNYWKKYAKDNFIGNSVNIPGYTTVNFTNNNLMRDYPYNMPEYPSLFEQLMNSKYGFSTNYNKEKDRLYDHLINNDNNRLFDYLIEVIKDNDGNIHHNYKMMKNITRGDKP